MPAKSCRVCGEAKPLEEFVKARHCPDGHENRCKACYREYCRRRNQNPNRKEWARAYNHTEHRREYRRVLKKKIKARQRKNPRENYPDSFYAPGFVYVFKWLQFYKIGRTIAPDKRIAALNGFLPHPGELIHVITTNNMAQAEIELHRRYADFRRNGEWFEISDDLVSELCHVSVLNF